MRFVGIKGPKDFRTVNYECFAGDGHWHHAAAHDPRYEGIKMAVGHFYALNLRTHTLEHLVAGEGLHEHDMSALKRVKPKGLRQGVPKGKRVLIVYDKAGIDFGYWKRCRQECAVYFLSRAENLSLCSNGEWSLYVADQSFGETHTLVSWGQEITPVPEPATITTIAGAVCLIGAVIRRLRKAKATSAKSKFDQSLRITRIFT